ncbi:MAG: HlyC/CorC family transporter [Deltaproteobacteria bacterium]|nr:MAG: HlyC/CorC family transporter [Deltaproteobacteria bacterium]
MVPAWQWITLAAALVGSAFFSSSETALTALGEARVRALIDSGGRRARLLRLWQKHPDRILSALLLGNTLVNVGMGSLTALIADEMGASHALALLTGLTTVIILLFGEITPKTFAKRHASGFAVFIIPLVALVYWILYPLAWLFVQLPRALARATGSDEAPVDSVTSQELGYLIEMGAKHGSIDKVREQLLSSVLAFTEVLVKEIMIPRTQVVALEETASYDEALKLVTESELSRIPVYRNSLDEIIGVLYVKSLLADVKKGIAPGQFSLPKYLRKPFFVPEAMKVSRLLTEMQKRRTHLATVVDEFGGTSGIVTLEDVVEEIVGEIHDESDIEDKKLKVLSDGVILADAQVSIRDLEEHLGIEFPEGGDYETLGGFLTATAGRVPPAGSLVVWGGLTFTVKAADDRRVQKVEIARKPAPGAAATGPQHNAPLVPPPDKVH